MHPDSENQPPNLAQSRLRDACATRDRAVRLRWILAICEVILLAGVALALLDYWWMLPTPVRVIGALGLAAAIAFGMVRLVWFYRKPTGLKQGALAIESERPELGCEISTAAEYLSGERKVVHEYEPELVAALEARAAQKLANNPIDYRPKLRSHSAGLGLCFLGVLALVIAIPAMLTAFRRTALPFTKAHYTQVKVQPGNIELPVGQDLTVTNVFSGRLPSNPHFRWQQAGNPLWQEVALSEATPGTYTTSLKNIRGDATYNVTGGDAVSDTFKITTYVPPSIKDLTVTLHFPDYTALKPSSQKSPDITAVRATTVQIQLEPSVELSAAQLRFSALPYSDGKPAMSPIGPISPISPMSPTNWIANLQITKDTDYWIELTDTKGHRGVNERPFHIRALPDNPPKVEISEPGKDIRASNTNKVLVKISVTDDFGVKDVRLVFNKLGGTQQTIPADRQSDQNGEISATAELDLSALDLKDYELVAYHAEATDNNTLDGPGIGKSPVYFVEITNEEGRPSLSQGQGQKVNLLVIQKQIIADSTALAPQAKREDFSALAARQQDASELAQIYLDTVKGGDAAQPAANEMRAALNDMKSATAHLQAKNRSAAVPAEEGALAHLYQVLKLLPELENLPTTPNMAHQQSPTNSQLQVVLEAIKQRKKEEANNQEVQEALKQAQDLARAQSALNSAMRHPGNGDSKSSNGQSSSPGDNPGGDQKDSQQATQQANAPNPGGASSPQQMAAEEKRLSEQAGHLAEMLGRLASKNSRLGHNAGNNASRAASQMAGAGQAMGQGDLGLAGEKGAQGEVALHGVIAQLERFLKNQPEPSDIANEDSPKAYEELISEYLKKLSHAE
jgi:hypothetical protein